MTARELMAARLRRPGVDPASVLLLVDRRWLEATGSADEHRVPALVLDRLWLSARRGVELDVVCDVGRVLRAIEGSDAVCDVAGYDAVVLLRAPGGAELPERLLDVVQRMAGLTRVLGAIGGAGRRLPVARRGAVRGWRDIGLVPGADAATVAEAVTAALVEALAPTAAPEPAPTPQDTLVDHLQRVVMIASSAFAVASCAIAVVTARGSRTIAAVGPALQDTGCADVTTTGPVAVLDTWLDRRFAFEPHRPGQVRFFAAHPLELADGVAVGSLAVFDTAPRRQVDFDPDVLHDLAELAGAELQHAGARG